MLSERIKATFGVNEPVFIEQIFGLFSEYSSQRIYQLLRKETLAEQLVKFDKGIYYVPTVTRYGLSKISPEQVINKRYIEDGGKVFGIYGGLTLQLNFLLSYQVPVAIEVISNNESTWVREVELKKRRVIVKKSRCEINNDNAAAYTLMELFNNIDTKRYMSDAAVQKKVVDFIGERMITGRQIAELAKVFPAKATKKLTETGVIYEIA